MTDLMHIRIVIGALTILAGGPFALFAQTRTEQPKPAAQPTEADRSWIHRISHWMAERASLSINGGGQINNGAASQSGTFQYFEETGTFQADYRLHAVPQIDGGIALRLWRNVGIGVAGSYFSGHTGSAVAVQAPHPFFAGTLRAATGGGSLHRQEAGVHLYLTYRVPLARKVDVILSGGPSAINIGQGVVTGVALNEAFPFNTVTLDHAITRRMAKTAAGFNVGTDVVWTFSRHVGLGALFRYSHARATLNASDTTSVSFNLGGLHTGLGVRLRF